MNLDIKSDLLVLIDDPEDDPLPAVPSLANLLAIDETWLCRDCDQEISRCICKRPS